MNEMKSFKCPRHSILTAPSQFWYDDDDDDNLLVKWRYDNVIKALDCCYHVNGWDFRYHSHSIFKPRVIDKSVLGIE